MAKTNIVARTGNEAMAEAMRQINPDVVAAYPITPATEIVQIFAGYVADGLVDTEFVPVESEHSAMSACIGASAAGGRIMTGTSSQGLALMAEMLYIASGLRLPIVMADVNRALSSPINIHCDHSDTMMVKDAGWIQIFSENAQEAYDNMIQAVRIAEEALLPVIVTTDGFIISHCMERIEIIDDKDVKNFVGEKKLGNYLLNVDKPITIGAMDLPDYYFEHKRQHIEAMIESKDIILSVAKEFSGLFGRSYGLFEVYRLEDADCAIVLMGSTVGTAKAVADNLREKGIKAGVLGLRVFRPFPKEEIAQALKNIKAIAVMDRSDSMNAQEGPVCLEVKASLFDASASPNNVLNYIYGLGGREVRIEDIESVYKDLGEVIKGKSKNKITYLGVRE
ncbi:MAG: pyruvate ferredoxin oxidoreductase [Omnitrophica bacterium RIFCSPLOWO2_02_FULL_45_16]|nr:MAG: pyruvate ferredoxin oxidoreductase [Omnitrophica bacterium RIFCSPLOWO2_12_FULL_45_13]OGX00664.1 MAG: pyruvate ferredoxin oxidoreductase [Omnitrophica bacterium RIFCSPLOWO2_02_FULL_45_16]